LRSFQWRTHDARLVTLNGIGSKLIPLEKKTSAIVLLNGPGSYENERTLGEIVTNHGAISMPSIYVWGGENDMAWEGQQKLKHVHRLDGIVIQREQGHLLPESEQEKV